MYKEYVNYKSEKVCEKLKEHVYNLIKENMNHHTGITVCGIGTDRVIGDAFGPFAGSALKDINAEELGIQILGTLDRPIHALNICKMIEEIEANNFVIALDASIGGIPYDFVAEDSSIRPGAGAGKILPKVGDVCVKFTVADDSDSLFNKSIRLYDVVTAAEIAANAIYNAIKSINAERLAEAV